MLRIRPVRNKDADFQKQPSNWVRKGMAMVTDYEKLGLFYLGRKYDMEARSLKEVPVLYDSKDLTTHAVIIGMTGSGKTGLGIGLLEEALIDGIPVIAIDPKGDLTNLMLTFPELRSGDFLPWINSRDALDEGLKPEEYAEKQAEMWKNGLSAWGLGPDRIARLSASAEFSLFTPGSSAGRQVSVLRSFSAPEPAITDDPDLFRDRIQIAATSLLAFTGLSGDPVLSREHILVSNILEFFWSEGRSIDIAGLIRAIQTPPFQRVGILDLESFFPENERFRLAMRLNNLLAAPGFEAWLSGEPLDAGRFLYTEQGKPKASIFTISHLDDTQRMFFVAMLLNEVLGWMRTQPGTSSLRAVLYMDEIFGYFPPVKNPPSKVPLLTLLKQARAYGLGVVLSTQNPVDLDYKGLSNTGTWFIGRLQTERDKERVVSGLEGAAAGSGFDRSRMEEILAGLGKRVFLLHNVHEERPVIFQTRWAMSYLRGPLSRDQIRELAATGEDTEGLPSFPDTETVRHRNSGSITAPPVIPSGIDEFFLRASGTGQGLVYVPGIIGMPEIHYFSAGYKVDTTEVFTVIAEFEDGPVVLDWDRSRIADIQPGDLDGAPFPGGEFNPLPTEANKVGSYRKWNRELVKWLRLNRPLVLFRSRQFRLTGLPGETEREFRARISQTARETRDLEVEKLRRKYASRFNTLNNRLLRAEQAVAREQDQARSVGIQTAVSVGVAILGAFFGRRAVSSESASKMGTALKTASRARKEKLDVDRAREVVESIRGRLNELEERLREDVEKIETRYMPDALEVDEIVIRPRSTDISMEMFGLVWIPYRKGRCGRLTPDWNRVP